MKKLIASILAGVMIFASSVNVFAADAAVTAQLQGRLAFLENIEKQLSAAVANDPAQTLPLASVKGQIEEIKKQLGTGDIAAAAEGAAAIVRQAAPAAATAVSDVSNNAAAAQLAATAAAAAQKLAADQQAQQAAVAAAQQAAAAAQKLAADQQAQQAAAAAAQQVAAAAAQIPAQAGHTYTDASGNSHTFTADEWNYLLGKWAYTGQAEELITHHSVGDLLAVLAAR